MRDYITCLKAMIRKMETLPSLYFHLGTLHRNIKPRLQQLIRRSDFEDIETLLYLAMEAELAVEAEKSFKPPPPPESCVYAQWAYKLRKMAPPKVKVAAVETKLPPTPRAPKMPTVEETMEKFAEMILDGMQRLQPPATVPIPPSTPLSPRNRTGEKRDSRRNSSYKRSSQRASNQNGKSNSSSESSDEERAKRTPRRTPGVIRRNCPKCAENAPQVK